MEGKESDAVQKGGDNMKNSIDSLRKACRIAQSMKLHLSLDLPWRVRLASLRLLYRLLVDELQTSATYMAASR